VAVSVSGSLATHPAHRLVPGVNGNNDARVCGSFRYSTGAVTASRAVPGVYRAASTAAGASASLSRRTGFGAPETGK
jgi:hypothetical protein